MWLFIQICVMLMMQITGASAFGFCFRAPMVNRKRIFNRWIYTLTAMIGQISWKYRQVSVSFWFHMVLLLLHMMSKVLSKPYTAFGPFAKYLQQFAFSTLKFIFGDTTQLANCGPVHHGTFVKRCCSCNFLQFLFVSIIKKKHFKDWHSWECHLIVYILVHCIICCINMFSKKCFLSDLKSSQFHRSSKSVNHQWVTRDKRHNGHRQTAEVKRSWQEKIYVNLSYILNILTKEIIQAPRLAGAKVWSLGSLNEDIIHKYGIKSIVVQTRAQQTSRRNEGFPSL